MDLFLRSGRRFPGDHPDDLTAPASLPQAGETQSLFWFLVRNRSRACPQDRLCPWRQGLERVPHRSLVLAGEGLGVGRLRLVGQLVPDLMALCRRHGSISLETLGMAAAISTPSAVENVSTPNVLLMLVLISIMPVEPALPVRSVTPCSARRSAPPLISTSPAPPPSWSARTVTDPSSALTMPDTVTPTSERRIISSLLSSPPVAP